MSQKTSAPSGMLNAYLHEQHCPYDHVSSSQRSSSEARKQDTATHKHVREVSAKEGVKDLDRLMRSSTDEEVLRKALKEEKG